MDHALDLADETQLQESAPTETARVSDDNDQAASAAADSELTDLEDLEAELADSEIDTELDSGGESTPGLLPIVEIEAKQDAVLRELELLEHRIEAAIQEALQACRAMGGIPDEDSGQEPADRVTPEAQAA